MHTGSNPERAIRLAGDIMVFKKLPIFRLRTACETFEADDFDWGEQDENGKQYFSFFTKGLLIRRLQSDEMCEIVDVHFVEVIKRIPSKKFPGTYSVLPSFFSEGA